MKPPLNMVNHSENDIYILRGEEVSYRESFESCLVVDIIEHNGKTIFYLGRNIEAFNIVNKMLCNLAGREFH